MESVFAIVALPGLAMGVFGVMLMLPGSVRKRQSPRGQGRVVATEAVSPNPGSDSEASTRYYAIVDFTTGDGRLVRARARNPLQFRVGKPGEIVTVFYSAHDPRRISIENTATRVATCLAGAFFAIAGFGFAIFLLVLGW